MVGEALLKASAWVWEFLRTTPFRPREETLTEVMLADFARERAGSIRVAKASISEEVADGLDWAWALETDSGWLYMLVQAKQIAGRRFGIYPELRKPRALTQARNLLAAAATYSAIPVCAFYNDGLPPFGPSGAEVAFGACGRGRLLRQVGPATSPWVTGHSPMGVTIAHAQDVLNFVLPGPASNQHALNVNRFAMPWECVTCPNWSSQSPSTVPAAEMARACAAHADPGSWSGADSSSFESTSARDTPPTWARLMLQDISPTEDEDAPPAAFYVVSRRPRDGD